MEDQISNLMREDLTDDEIRSLCPNTQIFLFNELARYSKLQDLFRGDRKVVIILFPVKSFQVGHWICIIKHDNYFEHFDPYGFDPIKEFDYTSVNVPNYLERFYTKCQLSGCKVVINTVRYQELKEGVNTCGRHTSCRAKMHYLDENRYRDLMFNQKYTPDQLVTLMTIITIDT